MTDVTGNRVTAYMLPVAVLIFTVIFAMLFHAVHEKDRTEGALIS